MSTTARTIAHAARRRTAPARRPVGAAAPLRDEYPAGWEDDHGLFTDRCTRWPVPVHRWSTSSHPPPSPPPSASPWRPASSCSPTPSSSPTDSPACCDLVERGLVPVWRARAISRETHDLSVEAVAFADRLICATPARSAWSTPPGWSRKPGSTSTPTAPSPTRKHELARRGVWLRHRGNPATTDVVMTLDTPDALLFDQTVGRIAGELGSLGDTDQLDVRRARAVGILADPQYALDLMSGRDAQPDGRCRYDRTSMCTSTPTRPGAGRRIEKLGAATTDLLNDWLTRYAAAGGKVIVRPVLDLTTPPRSTSTTHPARCGSSACCATPTASSPAAARDSRGCDLDHIITYIPIDRGRSTRPDQPTQPGAVCAGPITGSRPSPPGTTNASTTAPTSGPAPPDTSTKSTAPHRRPPRRT